MPEPLPFSFRNALRTIGPGAILLVGSIGMGEWIAGPLMVVQHGRGILWIATLAFVLQSLLNLEAVRYTLATGEPILVGFLRLPPGKSFWAWFYVVAAVAQLGVPAAAAGCAGILFAGVTGELPNSGEARVMLALTVVIVAVTAIVLVSGRTVERVLERVSWTMVALIFSFLVVVNCVFVPFSDWRLTFAGFFRFGELPENVDWKLLAVFAALAGSGGVGNLAISSWFRDKGFGMGGRVGSIGGALFGDEVTLAAVGKVFPLTEQNMSRWQSWWKYAIVDQSVLWAGGCMIGMFLTVNLAVAIVPPNTAVSGVAAGVFQVEHMRRLWSGFWLLGLLNGLWILLSTQLANTDCLVRTLTDVSWAASERVRRTHVSRVYAGFLLLVAIVSALAATLGNARTLLIILGTTAGPITGIAALQILWVNTRLLAPPLQPPWWRRMGLVLCSVFYFAVTAALVRQLFGG